jgi:hypothetical protein
MNGAAAQVRASSTLRAFAGVAKNGTAKKCVSRKPMPHPLMRKMGKRRKMRKPINRARRDANEAVQ